MEELDIVLLVDEMYKTQLFSERQLVSYLNESKLLDRELSEVEGQSVSLAVDVTDNHSNLTKYWITPIHMNTNGTGASLTKGGVLTFLVPYQYYNLVTKDYIRRTLKPVYQTGAWEIEMLYGITSPINLKYYEYSRKFLGDTIQESYSLNLRQKITTIFRDAIRNDIMDVVFLNRNHQVTILRKFINDFYPYTKIKITTEETDALANMLVSTFGKVEAYKVNSEPKVEFKIEHLAGYEDYEGRAVFSDTKDGYQIHVRIIKLKFNRMFFKDYLLAPHVKQHLTSMLTTPKGLSLVTGVRGSGKQVFLYTMINEYKKIKPNHFIETLEDPVEARLDGNIAQTEINEDKGFGFDYYLKVIKRHSANLYLIGELRDRSTSEAALTEASSGSLVWSTTHNEDCAGLFKKLSMELMDDGLLQKMVNVLQVVVNLTMSREICPKCRTLTPINKLTNAERKFLASWNYEGNVYKAREGGCDYCKGYNYEKISRLESDGNLSKPLIIVESLQFDRDTTDLCNEYPDINEKERVIRNQIIKEGQYKTQIALGLMNGGKLSLDEIMKLFIPNIYNNEKGGY